MSTHWKRLLPVVASVEIFALALHGLASEFTAYGYRKIRQAFHGLAWDRVLLALGSAAAVRGCGAALGVGYLLAFAIEAFPECGGCKQARSRRSLTRIVVMDLSGQAPGR